jgi:Na+/H+ antiporter NhaD/arsenite permease-like protein
MWRDIVTIIVAVLTVLMYFGLTPRRLSRYTKAEATRMSPSQRWKLSFAITLSLAYIPLFFIFAMGYVEFSLAITLRLIAGAGAIWFYTIAECLGLREKWGGKVILVAGLSFIALFISSYALSDMTLLEKIAYPAVTFGVACIIVAVRLYIERKREERSSSKEENV